MKDCAATGQRVPDVRRILVMRPNALGDYMFALPALHALRYAYPKARIVLLGLPWHVAFLDGRPGPVDEVRIMPAFPGIGSASMTGEDGGPGSAGREEIDRLRSERFDIALQMYGGGRYSNEFIRQLRARVSAGLATVESAALDRQIPYRAVANRRLQLLQVVELVGACAPTPHPELTATERDRDEAARMLPWQRGERIVVIHPGASDARRRWPAPRFAAVADRLADQGATVVISAGEADQEVAGEVVRHMRHPPAVAGRTFGLHALCGFLERACMVVANDTGPLHLAFALGTPGVGIFWLTNLVDGAPLRPQMLSAALSLTLQCPVCGAENVRTRCKHDVSFVDDVPTDEVIELALELYREVN